MTCPQCGAQVRPGDLFCMTCGRALNPGEPTRNLDHPVEPVYAEPAEPSRAAPPYAEPQPARETTWASGSSFPRSNPYASVPNTVSRGTMLNGRPVGRQRGGNGVLQGLGAAIVAIGVILAKSGAVIALALGKFGAVLAGIGIFKFLWLWWLFHAFANLLFWGHIGWIIPLIIVIVLARMAYRRRMI